MEIFRFQDVCTTTSEALIILSISTSINNLLEYWMYALHVKYNANYIEEHELC